MAKLSLKSVPEFADSQVDLTFNGILAKTSRVLGNRDEALRWMGTPVRALDFATPISLLGTRAGIDRVNHVLGQMEHGIW